MMFKYKGVVFLVGLRVGGITKQVPTTNKEASISTENFPQRFILSIFHIALAELVS
jgi:hypothetical protein